MSAASPAVERTLAVIDALYVLSVPGVNAPKLAGAPSVRATVAGIVPAIRGRYVRVPARL